MILHQATNQFFVKDAFTPNLIRLKQADGETITEVRLLSTTNLAMHGRDSQVVYGGGKPPVETLSDATIELTGKDGKTITIKAARIEALYEKE